MSDSGKKFWLEDPCILATNLVLFPTADMSKSEKLNALTRLALVIAAVMYFMNYEHWLKFAVISILILVILHYIKPAEEDKKEEFTIVPTYVGTDFQQTVVSPTFAEEWQIPPPAYDLYTQVPYAGENRDTFDKPLKPQSYPYGQYLTRTNLLPSDEYYTHLGCGGAQTAREYINSTYTRNDLAYRENISRIFKKKLARRYRHSSGDTFSPYHSY